MTESTRESWFSQICMSRRELQDIAGRLYELSCSCREVGLGMADELLAMGHKADDIENNLRIAIGQEVRENLAASEQASKNMIAAALVGAGCVKTKALEKILGIKEGQE